MTAKEAERVSDDVCDLPVSHPCGAGVPIEDRIDLQRAPRNHFPANAGVVVAIQRSGATTKVIRSLPERDDDVARQAIRETKSYKIGCAFGLEVREVTARMET